MHDPEFFCYAEFVNFTILACDYHNVHVAKHECFACMLCLHALLACFACMLCLKLIFAII